MKKIVSMSALVSGLLASPLLASLPAGGKGAGRQDCEPAESMALHLDAVTGGVPLEAELMAVLHQKMTQAARARIELALAEQAAAQREALVLIDDPAPATTEMSSGRSNVPGLIPVVQTLEKVAFLGIITSPANAALRDQVKLPRGFGLVVDMVVKDSPAATAGIQLHDILEKLDDQRLVNGEQLSVLVRHKKPGGQVAVTVIRGGERKVITVTLGEREVPSLEEPGSFQIGAGGGPVGSVTIPVDGGGGMASWQQGVRKTIVHGHDGSTTRTLMDKEGTITLVTGADGKSTVAVKDKDNVEQFNGPWGTEDEKAKVPAAYGAAVRDLAASNGPVMVHVGGRTLSAQDIKIKRDDAEQQIVLSITEGGKAVMVLDNKSGKVIYDGPLNGEEDWKKLPAGVAGKVKGMEAKLGLAG